MGLKNDIQEFKEKVITDIENSAKKGKSADIVFLSKLLEETEGLIMNLERYEIQFNSLKRKYEMPSANQQSHKQIISHTINSDENKISAKERGEQRRQAFIKKANAEGIILTQVKGVIYRTPSNAIVGIASASEKSPNHWFLGLPSKNYDTVVLLCENDRGELATFIPPKEFISKYLPNMSRDRKGQIKFNISYKFGTYYMTIPGVENQKLDQMKDRFDHL